MEKYLKGKNIKKRKRNMERKYNGKNKIMGGEMAKNNGKK